MSEIARLTGVSQPTVSRVLNGNTSVNPEIAKKVMACVEEHNYQPNMIARSLNGSRTYLLAAIVPDIANPFFADLIKVIEQEAAKAGYSILIFNSDRDTRREERYLGLLQQYRVDGVLAAPVHAYGESIKPFFSLPIPWMVLTNRVENANSVYVSHRKAGKLVAEHLQQIGVDKYIFIGERRDQKFVGFEEGLRMKGVDTHEDLLVFWEQDREKMLELLTGYLTELPGRAGIFALNDMEALPVMNALLAAGIGIPSKAALVGFDNTFVSRKVIPSMTTVRQPLEEMGRYAIQEILKQISRKECGTFRYKEFEAELIVRASSDGEA